MKFQHSKGLGVGGGSIFADFPLPHSQFLIQIEVIMLVYMGLQPPDTDRLLGEVDYEPELCAISPEIQ